MTQMTLSIDAFAADENYFYSYSEVRGLTRASKGRHGNWKGVDRANENEKGRKCVSLLHHDDKLFMRYQGQPANVAFVQYDKDTLQPM